MASVASETLNSGLSKVNRAPKQRMTGREKHEAWEALLFLSPWILGFLLFTGGPIVASAVLSFYSWDVISPAKYVGLENYRRLGSDPLLIKSLRNTIVYAMMYVPAAITMALTLAMLLNKPIPGMRFFRTAFYLPTLTQGVATFTLWSVVLEPKFGPLNRFLRLFIDNPPDWIKDPNWVKPALVVMAIWSVGGMMLIFLAGLKNIPGQLYEAAEIDGAGMIAQFWHITVPMLSPTIFFNTIISTIASFQVFAAAFVLTGVGPSNSTLFYVYYLFNRAFVYFNMGYAAAMAWLLFGIVLILTMIQIRLGKKWVHYG